MLRQMHSATLFKIWNCRGFASGLIDSDKIKLKGLVFHGYHGVLAEERTLGQKFVIDATLFCNLEAAGKTDELADTIDYAEVHRRIQTIVEGKPCNLIEKVAQNIADEVLNLDNRIQKVQISVQKPHVAVSGVLQSLGIEITRLNPSLCNPSRKTLS